MGVDQEYSNVVSEEPIEQEYEQAQRPVRMSGRLVMLGVFALVLLCGDIYDSLLFKIKIEQKKERVMGQIGQFTTKLRNEEDTSDSKMNDRESQENKLKMSQNNNQNSIQLPHLPILPAQYQIKPTQQQIMPTQQQITPPSTQSSLTTPLHTQQLVNQHSKPIQNQDAKRPLSQIIKMHDTLPYTDPLPQSYTLPQLPLCIITFNVSLFKLSQIQKSLLKIPYSNYIHVHSSIPGSQTLAQLYQLIHNECPQYSIVVLASAALKIRSLSKINQAYQNTMTWMTYHKRDGKLLNGVSTFYRKLMDYLTVEYLQKQCGKNVRMQIHLMAKSLMKLGKYRNSWINYDNLFYESPEREGVEYFIGKIDAFLEAEPISAGISLWEYPKQSRYTSYSYDRYILSQLKKQQQQQTSTGSQINQYHHPRNNLTINSLLRANQYLQLKNLPKQHSLRIREFTYYDHKYRLSQVQDQYPLCIIVPSSDNVQAHRYQKVIKSIHQQQYSNYFIVFIDDASQDQTFTLTQQYLLLTLSFPSSRVKFIRNQQKMFATYNIYQAVKNHCPHLHREIIVLVDGDDQLIGTQVFTLINAAYHHKMTKTTDVTDSYNQNWIVYFSFMSSQFGYGTSKEPSKAKLNDNADRQKYHVFGALRTFYSQLYLKIDEKDHKDQNGEFLKTIYDDALQYPLFQMAGLQHIEYIPQMVYFYNRFYGKNDDSTRIKQTQRNKQHQLLLKRPKYTKISTLFAPQ